MPEPIVLYCSRIEDILDNEGNLVGKRVIQDEHNSINVKSGRKGSNLKERWDELTIGKFYRFERAEYKGHPYPVDFTEVKDALEQEAYWLRCVKVKSETEDIKNKSVCLSYAKDTVCHVIDWMDVAETKDLEKVFIKLNEMTINLANQYYSWLMKGEINAQKSETSAQINEQQEAEEQMAEPENGTVVPRNIQALLNWVASHKDENGKAYTRSWVLKNFSQITEDRMRDEPQACYKEIKELMGW